jgi:hypothetical protein
VRVVHWILHLLAAMAFIVPAVYLVQAWQHKAPLVPGEVDAARVEANSDGYRVSLPNGARYQLTRSEVSGSPKRGAAIALVRSRLSNEYSTYMQMWSRFWFLLAGACGVAMLLTFASQLLEDREFLQVNAARGNSS